MRSSHATVGLACGLSFLLVPSLASAADVSDAFQLGLGTPILERTSANVEYEVDPVQAETDTTTTRWGLGHSVVTELGYGLSEMLVLGAFVEIGGVSQTDTDQTDAETDTSEFSVFLGPKLDIMFSPGANVMPFVGAAIGYGSDSTKVTPDNDPEVEISASGFRLGLRGGVRAFVADGLSIDPQLAFGYASLSGDADVGAATADINASGYSIGVSIALSGWLK